MPYDWGMNRTPNVAVLSRDTHPDAERVQIELWRRMSPLQKAQAVSAASRAVCDLSIAGIRRRTGCKSDRECLAQFALLTLGRELAGIAYPERPDCELR